MRFVKNLILLAHNIFNEGSTFDLPELSYNQLSKLIAKEKMDGGILHLWMRFKGRTDKDSATNDFGDSFSINIIQFRNKMLNTGFEKTYADEVIKTLNAFKVLIISYDNCVGDVKPKLSKEPKKDIVTSKPNYEFDISQYNTSSIDEGVFSEQEKSDGISPYKPISVNNTFNAKNKYMYYPVEIVVGHKEKSDDTDESIKILEHLRTIVVRSDRTIRQSIESDAPNTTNKSSRIHRLDDGTLIDSAPKPNNHATWEWESINRYLNGETYSKDLSTLLHEMHSHLRGRVWLPNEDDYWLLSCVAMASYSQNIFNAVPLILFQGQHGSGKSELGSAIKEISANAVMIGQVSAAAMARLIDESSGLAVIDDLESIGRTKGGGFSEVAQTLKVSQKKSTAVKAVTDPTTQKTRLMNFYGIKVISNTMGSDEILGSRILKVKTQRMPENVLTSFLKRPKFDEELLPELRNECHCWTFENVDTLHSLYLDLFEQKTNREEEISIPIKLISMLSENQDIIDSVNRALNNQNRIKSIPSSPSDVIAKAVTNLIKSGFNYAFPTHIALEVKHILNPAATQHTNLDVPIWVSPEAIGKKVRALKLNEPSDKGTTRKRLHEKNLRVIAFDKKTISKIRTGDNSNLVESAPESFCKECSTCKYNELDCSLKASLTEKKSIEETCN